MNDYLNAEIRKLADLVLALPQAQQRRLLAGVAGVIVAVFALLLLNARAVFQARLDQRAIVQNELAWMRAQAPLVQQALEQPEPEIDSRSLIAIANQAAAARNVNIARFKPDDKGHLRLWVEGAEYDAAIRWVKDIYSTAGVYIESLTINRTEAVGVVTVNVLISKNGSGNG